MQDFTKTEEKWQKYTVSHFLTFIRVCGTCPIKLRTRKKPSVHNYAYKYCILHKYTFIKYCINMRTFVNEQRDPGTHIPHWGGGEGANILPHKSLRGAGQNFPGAPSRLRKFFTINLTSINIYQRSCFGGHVEER